MLSDESIFFSKLSFKFVDSRVRSFDFFRASIKRNRLRRDSFTCKLLLEIHLSLSCAMILFNSIRVEGYEDWGSILASKPLIVIHSSLICRSRRKEIFLE